MCNIIFIYIYICIKNEEIPFIFTFYKIDNRSRVHKSIKIITLANPHTLTHIHFSLIFEFSLVLFQPKKPSWIYTYNFICPYLLYLFSTLSSHALSPVSDIHSHSLSLLYYFTRNYDGVYIHFSNQSWF